MIVVQRQDLKLRAQNRELIDGKQVSKKRELDSEDTERGFMGKQMGLGRKAG